VVSIIKLPTVGHRTTAMSVPVQTTLQLLVLAAFFHSILKGVGKSTLFRQLKLFCD